MVYLAATLLMMSAADAAPWITLIALLAASLWQYLRETRQRKWDLEDRKLQRALDAEGRAELAATAAATLQLGQANGVKMDAAVERADLLMTKTDEIHTATNGNLSEMRSLLAVATQEIVSMKEAVGVAKQRSDEAVQVARDTPVEKSQ